jgi:hypothetical protein
MAKSESSCLLWKINGCQGLGQRWQKRSTKPASPGSDKLPKFHPSNSPCSQERVPADHAANDARIGSAPNWYRLRLFAGESSGNPIKNAD